MEFMQVLDDCIGVYWDVRWWRKYEWKDPNGETQPDPNGETNNEENLPV
eukprot:CAMPEP_0117059658 /NCGR_PEP_ID=MMETSP0472-20121206/41464_1 /TAXON_ID=693140 ORGANISM="Tiarina fusus, Strain LIS" /NCGR_SAMPLE_ID=MMETSP0472 /ASSEMBLY_ACC=CAM_ASM_000603 /LENGTH=48 /DNA_ID= /DNA_START= /DNA_END= /DNA_ORIENTATION=